jgi:hypothetical protein
MKKGCEGRAVDGGGTGDNCADATPHTASQRHRILLIARPLLIRFDAPSGSCVQTFLGAKAESAMDLIETKAQPRIVCGIRIGVANIREVNSVPACNPADQGIIDRKDTQRWMLVS